MLTTVMGVTLQHFRTDMFSDLLAGGTPTGGAAAARRASSGDGYTEQCQQV